MIFIIPFWALSNNFNWERLISDSELQVIIDKNPELKIELQKIKSILETTAHPEHLLEHLIHANKALMEIIEREISIYDELKSENLISLKKLSEFEIELIHTIIPDFLVNDDVGSGGQYYPSIAADGNGNFVITWGNYCFGDPNIYGRCFNSDGEVLDIAFCINNTFENNTVCWLPSVAMYDGKIYTAWRENRKPGRGFDIFANVLEGNNPDISLTISDTETNAGNIVSIPIVVDFGFTNVAMMELHIKFDTTPLYFQDMGSNYLLSSDVEWL